MGKTIADYGELVGLCGWNGATWEPILIDGTNRLIIAIASLPLPTDAATSAKQLPDGHNVTVDNPSLAVTGTFYQVTQPVSAATLPLPTGASIETKQNTIIMALQSIQNLVGALHDVGLDELDIQIAGQAVDVEVKQTTPADLVVAQHQYDGSGWKKSNLLWGFNDRVYEDLGGTVIQAGIYTGSSTPVPEGEVHVIEAVSTRNTSRAGDMQQIRAYAGASYVHLLYEGTPVRSVPVIVLGPYTLKQGDFIRIYEGNTQVGDNIDAGIWGYKMDIAM